MAAGIFPTKAAAQAFAATVVGWACRAQMHGIRCQWIDAKGSHDWPMPIGQGVQATCTCDCHGGPAQATLFA